MIRPEDAAQFVADWWELSGNIVTTLQALRRLKQDYPQDYLQAFCHPEEIASKTAALQEICRYLQTLEPKAERNTLSAWRKMKRRRG